VSKSARVQPGDVCKQACAHARELAGYVVEHLGLS